MKRRLLSAFLALVMAFSLLPMSAFAADATDASETRKTNSATVPPTDAPVEGYEWVLKDEIGDSTLVCTNSAHEDDHTHKDECYDFHCTENHPQEHTSDCYEPGTNAKWKPCDNQNHYNVSWWGELRHQGQIGDGCWLGAILNFVAQPKVEWFQFKGFEGPAWAQLAMSQIGYSALGTLSLSNLANYFYYDPGEDGKLICTHEHDSKCYSLNCDKSHTDACFETQYTWVQQIKTYTVTFNSNGGTTVENNTVNYGDTISAPSTTRDGFEFLGWYDGDKVFDFSTEIKTNYTLTAQWKPVAPTKDSVEAILANYKVIVDCVNSDVSHDSGEYGILPSCITVGNVTSGTNGYEVTVTLLANNYATHYSNGHTTENEDVTLTLAYGDNGWALVDNTNSTTFDVNCVTPTVTVTFDANGGNCDVTSQTVKANSKVSQPTASRTDYSLDGWYTATGAKWNFTTDTVGEENITLTARWTLNKPSADNVIDILGKDFKVFVDCTNSEMSHETKEYSLDKDSITVGNVVNNSVVVTIASNAYVAKYISGHSNVADQTVTLVYGANGWQVNNNVSSVTFNVLCATVYEVTFVANNGTDETATQAFNKGETKSLTANTFTYTNHAFVGWAKAADGDVIYADKASVSPTGNMTLYAVWASDGNNNGVDDANETITVSKTGNGTVSISGADAKTNDGGVTWIYNSKATDKTITVTTDPADGNYLVSTKVDDKEFTDSFAASGKHTVSVNFGAMSITAEDAVMDRYKVAKMNSSELVAAIKAATNEKATPESIESGIVTEYLAADYGTIEIPSWVLYIGGSTYDLKYWATPGEVPSVSEYLSDFVDSLNLPFGNDVAKAYLEGVISKLENVTPHAFGAQTTEQVRYTYKDIQKKVTVTLEDLRIETAITGENVSVVYGSFTSEELLNKINAQVTTPDGTVIENAEVSVEDITDENVGEHDVTISFGGDDTYKPCKGKVAVTITKAPSSLDVSSQIVKYSEVRGSAIVPAVTTTPADIDTIDFVVGLDVHDETALTGIAQISLNMDQNAYDVIRGAVLFATKNKVDIAEDISLNDLGTALTYLAKYSNTLSSLADEFGIDTAAVGAILQAMNAAQEYIPEDLKIQITNKITVEPNVGLYLVGSVTANTNYQTSFDVGYLVITPNGVKAELDWVQKEEDTNVNGVIALPNIQTGAYDLSAKVTDIVESTIEGADASVEKANQHVEELFIGFDTKGNLILTQDQNDLTVGAFTEVAYVTNWDNDMYYAEPIARAFVVSPALVDVDFVNSSTDLTENSDRVFTYDGTAKAMPVAVNGTYMAPGENLTVTYIGSDTTVDGWYRETPPTDAGVYTVIAVYTQKDTDGTITHAGSTVGVMVIEPADTTVGLNDKHVCPDGNEHFAEITNPALDYVTIAVNREKNIAYVNLPEDTAAHLGRIADYLPASVKAELKDLADKYAGCVDNQVSNTELKDDLIDVLTEIKDVNADAQAKAMVESIIKALEEQMMSDAEIQALLAQIETELKTLETDIRNQIPDEIEAELSQFISDLMAAGTPADLEQVKAELKAQIEALNLDQAMEDEFFKMVDKLAAAVKNNEDLAALQSQAEAIIAKLESLNIDDAETLVKAILGAIYSSIDNEQVKVILADAALKVQARGYVEYLEGMAKNIADIYGEVNINTSALEKAVKDLADKIDAKIASGDLDADDLANLEKAVDDVLAGLIDLVDQMPEGTIIFGHNPKDEGVYDCYAINISANYKAEFVQAKLTIGHDWGDWTQTKAPTCTNEGEETRICAHNDSHKDTRAVDVDENAHAWGDWTQTKAPTCTTEGVETRICAHNDSHKDTRAVDVDENAHAWGDWTQTKAPTTTAEGEEQRVCKHNDKHIDTRPIDKLPGGNGNGGGGGNGGGNGGGGNRPSDIPDVPPALNGDEHFAYITGYPDGTVNPGGNITRAEVATIFFRLLDKDIRDGSLSTSNDFADVNEGDWYNTAVSTMAALGIVNGRTATEFAPNANITRAEFATICSRFVDMVTDVDCVLTDIDGHWAEDYILNAVALGWVNGYEDNTFRPDQSITRAESMTLINRVLHRIPESVDDLLPEMKVWTDNSNEAMWYYLAVQEATNSHEFQAKGEKYESWTALTENPDWSQYQ